MKIIRHSVAAIALAALPAFAQSDAGGDNHYILECADTCRTPLVSGAIGPGHTGAWYNPAQGGHGLFVEVLPDNKIQAAWFTFNPGGTEQAWFVGVGTYSGNKATISAMAQPTGGRWIPHFDPSRVIDNTWGALTLTFNDADNGTAVFASTSGYGTGSIALTRLTRPAAAKDPYWTRTGAMNFGRLDHKAMLLPNGKVLVVGGFEAFGSAPFGVVQVDPNADTVELFDPATGTWELTGKLNTARGNGLAATLLQDGNVLVTGGVVDCRNASCGFGTLVLYAKSAELYDVRSGTWRFTGSMNSPRQGHTASLLADGRVLVAGGSSSFAHYFDSAELYDPGTGIWTDTGALNFGREGHSATVLQDGKVLVFGGHIHDNDMGEWIGIPTAELYDPVAGTWTPYDGPPEGTSFVSHGRTVRLADGSVMSVGVEEIAYAGSNKSFVFDPITRNWANSDRLITARFGHSTTVLSNGDVLVTGGRPSWSSPLLAGAERYQLRSKKWVLEGTLNTPRIGHSATLLPDGSILFAGGYAPGDDPSYPSSAVVSNEAELFLDGQFSPSAIRPGFTGSWYDPAQSGTGLLIEVLPGNQFLAVWFAFNPAGTAQSWFLGVGTYAGNTATISSVVQPTGGRWIPNFDPRRVVNNPWGTLKFTFTDCNHGKVDFASTLGYGTGSMNLTRLTLPAGLACP
jgi:hypothetical protein